MDILTVQTIKNQQAVAVTDRVESVVRKAGLISGAVLVYCPHTTAGLTVNECADPTVMQDLEGILHQLVPPSMHYRHGEGNSHAHARAMLVGSSVCVPVKNGRLCLGTWQGIFFLEFDGPRQRTVYVQCLQGHSSTDHA